MNALRLVFLLLAVGVLGIVGWRAAAVRPQGASAPPRPIVALAEAMLLPATPLPNLLRPIAAPPVDRVADNPAFANFFDRMKIDFPRDYGAVAGRLGQGGGDAGADAVIWDALRDVEQSQGVLAAGAAPEALDRFFDARSALLNGLAPLDARQCVDFLYGMTDASIADFTAAHRGLVATLADRTLDVIADGRDRHLDRAAPTEADLDALSSGLAERGLSPTEIGVLIDGTMPDTPIPDARLCTLGRTYLDVLHGLPAGARQRIYGLAAELLARS